MDYVPSILQEQQAQVHREILGRQVSVIFEGTSRLEEALAFVVQFISDEFTIEQCLVKLQMLVKSIKDDGIAREVISILSVTYMYRAGLSFLLVTMRDTCRASVNNVALTTMKVALIMLVGCNY